MANEGPEREILLDGERIEDTPSLGDLDHAFFDDVVGFQPLQRLAAKLD